MSGFRPRFFVPGDRITVDLAGHVVALDAEDSYHAVRVLRLRPGEECEVVVGPAVHAATMLPSGAGGAGKAVQLRLGARLEGPDAGARYSHMVALVQALARPSVVEWTIEKSTEAGASLILVVQTAGSPRLAGKDFEARLVRWTRIAREAAKQSKQPAVPAIETAPSITAALERLRVLRLGSIMLDPGAAETLPDRVAGYGVGSDGRAGIALWIGPESGWSEAEREGLLGAGGAAARLGRGVLRTETAGPVAIAVARLALGDW